MNLDMRSRSRTTGVAHPSERTNVTQMAGLVSEDPPSRTSPLLFSKKNAVADSLTGGPQARAGDAGSDERVSINRAR